MKKIVIDAYQASAHITGTDRLAYNILRELQHLDKSNDYTVITNADHSYIGSCITAPNFRVFPVRLVKRATWLMLGLPLTLFRNKANAFFSFHNLAGPGIRVCYTVGSLLDMIPISQPNLYFDRDSFLRRFIVLATMKRAVRTSDHFMAISHFTKSEAVKYFGIDPKKISVVHLQADPMFFKKITAAKRSDVGKKYSLPGNYVFALGSSEPRKNVVSVIAAHRQMPENIRQKFPLIIGGAKWHNREVQINNDPYIQLTGFIDDADLPAVYSLASLFVFPSLYEGFGMPVLEAMACGTPVIASETTSVPEATGTAAVLVDPADIKAISLNMKEILSDTGKRRRMSEAGKKQVNSFSWRRSAQDLHKILVQKS